MKERCLTVQRMPSWMQHGERRLFHVLNRTTETIIGTGVIRIDVRPEAGGAASGGGRPMFHPAARGFGLASLLVKIMMVYAINRVAEIRRMRSISPMS